MHGMGQTIYDNAFAEGYAEGYAENYAEGYAEGLELGERQFAKLISILFKENKIDEIKLVISDADARHKMFQEYNITDENI